MCDLILFRHLFHHWKCICQLNNWRLPASLGIFSEGAFLFLFYPSHISVLFTDLYLEVPEGGDMTLPYQLTLLIQLRGGGHVMPATLQLAPQIFGSSATPVYCNNAEIWHIWFLNSHCHNECNETQFWFQYLSKLIQMLNFVQKV